jgi:MFS family permease
MEEKKMALQPKHPDLVYDPRSNFGKKGWWIIIFTALTMFVFCAIASLSMNVVVPAKAAQMGVEFGTLLSFNTLGGIIALFASLGLSQMAIRYGLKKVHIITLLIGAVAVIFWGLAGSLVTYVIPIILMFCCMTSTEVVSGKIVANWFPKKKGIASGWATMGLNASSIVSVPVMIAILTRFGDIKYVLFFLAGELVVLTVLTIVAYRDYPEEWNAFPDNNPNEKRQDVQNVRTGWTTGKVFRQKETWLIAIGVGLVAMTTFGYVSSVIPAMTMKGFSESTAMMMMAASSLFGFAGSYLFGYFDQKFGTQKSAIILSIWLIVAILFFFMHGTVGGWIYVIMMGVSIGATNNYPISITAQIFGRTGFQVAYPVVYLIKGAFQYGVYVIQGQSLNRTGGYGFAWGIIIALVVVSIVIFYNCNMNPKKDPIESMESVS